MYKEYDVIRLMSERLSPTIPIGSKGAVLVVYDAEPAAYEVEFIAPDGRSLGVETVKDEDIAAWRDQ